jgi:YHS domain-containing protein
MKPSLLGSIVACVLVLACSVCLAEDKKADKAKDAKPINKKCPVEGGDVDPKLTTEYKGKTIGFCCDSCPAEFKKDPAKYMAIVDKELAKDKPADKSKDEAKKSADKEKDKKKEQKLNTKCPVSGDDADKTLTTEYKGRTVAFCCEDCIKDFKKDPKKYMAKLEEQDKADKKAEKDKSKDAEKDKKAEK